MEGFEPTKHIAHDLKSGPVDRLGTLPFYNIKYITNSNLLLYYFYYKYFK